MLHLNDILSKVTKSTSQQPILNTSLSFADDCKQPIAHNVMLIGPTSTTRC